MDDFLLASASSHELKFDQNAIDQKFKAKFPTNEEKFVGLNFNFNGEVLRLHQREMIQALKVKYEILHDHDQLPDTPMAENMQWSDSS